MENFVREKFNEINEMTKTNDLDYYNNDYLHLLNHCTTEEEVEIKSILENILKGLERISEIQDDCYSR